MFWSARRMSERKQSMLVLAEVGPEEIAGRTVEMVPLARDGCTVWVEVLRLAVERQSDAVSL